MYSKSLISRLGAACLLTALLAGGDALADVVLDTQENNKTTTVANTLTWNHTCSGGNRILIVTVASNNKGGTEVQSVTYGGTPMTELLDPALGTGPAAAQVTSGDVDLTVWGLVNPTGNMNLPVLVTLTGGDTRMITAGSVSFYNTEQVLPTANNGRVTSALGNGGLGVNEPSVTVNNVIVGDIAIDALGVADTPVIAAVDPSQVQIYNIRTTDTPAADQVLNAMSFEIGNGALSMDWALDMAGFDWAMAGIRIAAAPPTLSSAANQVFVVGDRPTDTEVITVQDNGAIIDATTDIRIKIPAGFNMTWDTTVLSYSAGGTASLKVNPGAVGYEDGGRTAVIDVLEDLETFDTLLISDLKFANFSGGSPPDNLELEVKNDGISQAMDSATIEVRAPTISYTEGTTTFQAGSDPSPALGIMSIVVQDNASQALIKADNTTGDIRIRIPDTLSMTWDTAVTMPTLTPSGAGTVDPTVTYEDNDKTVRIDVTGNFGASETLTVTGLKFANFTAKFGPGKLALDVRNNDGTAAETMANLEIQGASMTSSDDQEFAVLNPSDVALATITVSEDTSGTITMANDIRIRIPNAVNMFWDHGVLTAAAGSISIAGGVGTVAGVDPSGGTLPIPVSYSADNKTLIIDILADFTGNEVVTINTASGLEFTGFFTQSGLDNLELVVDGNDAGNVAAFDAKTVVIAGAQIASAADKSFRTGVATASPAVDASTITVTESAFTTTITPANDIRIRIPTGVDMKWNQTVTMPTFGGIPGGVAAKVDATVSYPDARTLLINVNTPFALSDKLTVSGLKFTSFGASSEDFLELDTLDDITKVGATDPMHVRVVAPTLSSEADQLFQLGAPVSLASKITVTEDANEQTITMGDDIRIRIPGSVDMVWDSSIDTMAEGVSLTVTGTGGAVAFPVTFESGDKVAVINVTADFDPGDILEIEGLQFKSFTTSTAVPDSLELVVTGAPGDNANATDDKTKTITGFNEAPSFSAAGDFEALAGTGVNTISGWLQGIGPGVGESGQTVTFTVTTDNDALFVDNNPAPGRVIADIVSGPGTYPDEDLVFELSGTSFGVANITVTAMDDGGTANGGIDSSASQTYTIIVIEGITQVDAVSQHADTTLSKTSWSHTVGTDDNRALVVGIASHDTGETHPIAGVTFNGVAMTQVGSLHVDDDAETLLNTMWVLDDPDSGAHTIQINVGGSGNIPGLSAGAVSFSGVDGASLVLGGSGGFTGQSITPRAVFSGVAADQVVVDSLAVIRSPFANGTHGASVTVFPTVAGMTKRWDTNDTSTASFQDHILSAGSTRINSRGTITNRWEINTATARSWSILAGIMPSAGSVQLSSAANEIADEGDPPEPWGLITITESAGTPQITAANDIRIRIPDGVDFTWDNTVPLGGLTFGGTYPGNVTAVTYSADSKTLTLDIDTDFMAQETLTIDGLVRLTGMASGPDNLELLTSNAAADPMNLDPAITEDDKIMDIGEGLKISSADNQSFVVNDNPTFNSLITITDYENTAEILMGNTICIDIPAGVDMTWDSSDLTALFGGPAFMKVAGPPVYSNGDKRMCVSVIADFLPGEVLTISGLKFANFGSSSGPASLTLDVDGDANIDVQATDDKGKAVGEPLLSSGSQTFLVYDGITVADTITLTEDAFTPTLTDADEIRIQIPAGLDMEWDTSNTTPTLTGTFITNGGGVDSVTYPDNKTMLISIDRDFAPLETLIIADATFANFGVATDMGSGPDNLGIIVSGPGAPVAATDPQSKTVLQPTIETATMIDQSFVVKSTDQSVEPIKITDDLNVATILADNGTGDIRIVIPGALDLTWDTSITLPTFDTTGLVYGGAISPMVSYEDAGKTLVIDVTSDFGIDPGVAADSFTISGLEFENLNSGSPPDSLELEVRNDGLSRDEDPYTKEILTLTISSAANQNIPINSPDQVAETITITDASGTALIKAGNLYVRIPESLDMEFVDPPAGGVTASGTAVTSGHVAAAPAIVYLNDAMGDKKIACIPVGTDFDPDDTLILAGLEFTGFSTVTDPDNLELIIDGNPLGTTVAEDDKFKRTSAAIITSAADQFFLAGDGLTPISPITIIEHPTSASITMANGIVIDIPAGLDMTWDTLDFSATFGGTFITGGGTIAALGAGSYTMGGKRLTLIPSRDFLPWETLTIADLGFIVGSTPSALDKLELSVDGGVSVADEDDKNKAIGLPTLSSAAGSEFSVGDPATVLPTITITESAGPTITAANDIMIKLPATFNGSFDETKVPTFGGSAAGKVAGVSYPGGGPVYDTIIVNVTSDFVGNDTLTLDDLCLKDFTANSPADNMELYIEGPADVTVEAYDDKFLAIGREIFHDATSCNTDMTLGDMTQTFNHTIGGENNRLLVVGITVYDTTAAADTAITGVTYGGQALMQAAADINPTGPPFVRTELWYILEADLPAAGSHAIVVNYAGANDDRIVTATSVYNARQTAPVPEATASSSADSGASPYTTGITTLTDNAWVFDEIGTGASTSFTPDAAQLERCDTMGFAGLASGAMSTKEVGAAGATTMEWTGFTTGSPTAHALAAFAPFVVNQPPTLTDVAAMVLFAENTVNAAPQIVDTMVTLTDIDSPDFDGGNLTIDYSVGGGAEDQLSFATSGNIRRTGNNIEYMTGPGVYTVIGTVPGAGAGSGVGGESFIVTFNANATPARVDELIQAMTYQNTSDMPAASRTIEITVNDGDGGTSAPVSTVINVAPGNDRPTLTMVSTLGPGGFFEDTANQITYATLAAAANENDPDGDTVLFTIESVLANSTLLHVDAGMTTNPVVAGVTTLGPGEFLLWTPPADENNVTEGGAHSAFTVTATDGTLSSAPAVTVPISVTPCNDPPSFNRGPDIIVATGTMHNAAWATSISPGPADESGQTVGFVLTVVSTDNASLFATAPTVTAAGVLDFDIAAGQSGYARVSVVAQDNGGTANACDDDTSDPQYFVISTPVRYRRCGLINNATNGPSFVAIGDFRENDNNRDLFIANMTADTIGIWLGNGATRFTYEETLSLPGGSSPAGIALGDYNRDGFDDIAVVNFGANNVMVYETRLDQMTLTDTEAVGTDPMFIAGGDLNGDGRTDLVTANSGSDNISVLLALGGSTFSGKADTAIGAGSNPAAVALGYFNADSNLDMAVAQFGLNRVSFHLGDGAGGFSSSTFVNVGTQPISLAGAQDYNGDGHVDIVVANFGSDNVMLIRGNGDGTFNAPGVMDTVAVGDEPRHVAERDIDDDGDLDVIVANRGDDTVSVIVRGMGAPTVETWPLETGSGPVAVATGNFNGPRNGEEIAVCNFANNTFQILCNVFPHVLSLNSTDRSLDVLEDASVDFEIQATVLTRDITSYNIIPAGPLTGPFNGTLTGTPPNLTYTPDPDFYGTDSFKFTASTPLLTSSETTFTIWIQSVNDKPTMTVSNPALTQNVSKSAGMQMVTIATGVSKGPANESGQKVRFILSPHQSFVGQDIFAMRPFIVIGDTTATLVYEPNPNYVGTGTATRKFLLIDNGGRAFGGMDSDLANDEITINFTFN